MVIMVRNDKWFYWHGQFSPHNVLWHVVYPGAWCCCRWGGQCCPPCPPPWCPPRCPWRPASPSLSHSLCPRDHYCHRGHSCHWEDSRCEASCPQGSWRSSSQSLRDSWLYLSVSHSQSQSAAHKISRLGNLFLLLWHEAGLTIVTDWRQQSPGASRKFLHLISVSWSRVYNVIAAIGVFVSYHSISLETLRMDWCNSFWVFICSWYYSPTSWASNPIANHDQSCNSWADWRLAITLPSRLDPAVAMARRKFRPD